MKKRLTAALLFILILMLSSCQMEAAIPENSNTFSHYMGNKEEFHRCIEYLAELGFDALISRNDYYSVEGSENFDGLYLQNMEDMSLGECTEPEVISLFENTDVKMIDYIKRDDLQICAFDMCIPGKNFDFGIYYSSGNEPIYFGDPSLELVENGNGYSCEEKASYGAKFTYYTEKIEDNYFYYEIS